jgi:putative glutamine amidotransferase
MIGITMRLEIESRRFYLGRDYSEALAGNGAVPVQIPLIPDEGYLRELVASLDGILLPGSDTDPDPYRYGEDPHPKLGRVIPDKDETDLLVLRLAEERQLPLFGICFGMQILNVFRRGSLVQDIPSMVRSALKHEQGLPLDRNSHRLLVEKGSLVERLAGANEDIFVNTHHHQSVKDVGENLTVTARTADGVVEAVEDTREERFVVGVQWHPELSWRTDPLSKGLFETFVAKCSSGL